MSVHSASAVLICLGYAMLSPILSLEAQAAFGAGSFFTGGVFAASSTGYVVLTPLIGAFADSTASYRSLVCVGAIVTSLSLAMVAPFPGVARGSSIHRLCFLLGVILMGVATAMGLVPILPDLMRAVSRGDTAHQLQITGLCNFMFSLGVDPQDSALSQLWSRKR